MVLAPSSLALVHEAPLALVLGGALAVVALVVSRRASPSKRHDASTPRDPPTLPSTLPVLGNLLDMLREGDVLYEYIDRGCKQFDYEPWKFTVPGRPDFVVLSSPEAIEDVTITQFDVFPKGEFIRECVRDMFGDGMITSDGDRWYHQRKIGAKFFSAKVMRKLMHQSVYKNLKRVHDVLDASIATGAQVELTKLFMEFTIETFAETGMGVKLNCIGATEPHPFQEGLDESAPSVSSRSRLPTFVWKIMRWLQIGPERVLAHNMGIVRGWLNEVIQNSLDECVKKSNNISEDDIKSVVELFITYGDKDGVEGVEPQDLLDFMLTFVIAARDTTADTLSWMMLKLRDHPEVMRKIRDEIRAVVGNEKVDVLTSEHTKHLVYLEATIKETLRHYPAAPITVRQANRDTIICGNVRIRKGDTIGLCASSMGRNPKVWGPDAAEFKPERWINPDNKNELLQFPATKFFSFSAGPRMCIGMNLAMMELRALAANLFYRYQFDVDPSNDGSYVVAPTFNMKYPLLARVHRL